MSIKIFKRLLCAALALASLMIAGGWGCDGEKKNKAVPETSAAADSTVAEPTLDTIVATDNTTEVLQDTTAKADDADIFTDDRDGKVYKLVKIGNQIWMAENLNYVMDSSWCYDNIDSNCVKYGRLYIVEAAMSACPTGWRLPSRDEWHSLIQISGAPSAHLASEKWMAEWGLGDEIDSLIPGDNKYGFSALGGGLSYLEDRGYRYYQRDFEQIDWVARWWSSTKNEEGVTYHTSLYSDISYISEKNRSRKGEGLSVRCIKDMRQ